MASLGNKTDLSKVTATEASDVFVSKLQTMFNTSDIQSPSLKQQASETVAYLKDLKTSDPEKYAKLGEVLKRDEGKGFDKLEFAVSWQKFIAPKKDAQGNFPALEQGKMKSLVNEIIDTPNFKIDDFSNKHFNRDYKEYFKKESTSTPSPQSKAEGTPTILAEANSPASPSTMPGAVATMLGRQDPTGFQNTMASGGSFGMAGNPNAFSALVDAMKSAFSGFSQSFSTSNLASIGNDTTQKLTGQMAKLTGTDPSITTVAPNGATTDLGAVSQINRDPVLAMNDPRYDRNNVPGISTPSMGMGRT